MLLHKKHTHEADPGPVLKMAVFSNKISKRKKKKSNSTAINWERVLEQQKHKATPADDKIKGGK